MIYYFLNLVTTLKESKLHNKSVCLYFFLTGKKRREEENSLKFPSRSSNLPGKKIINNHNDH